MHHAVSSLSSVTTVYPHTEVTKEIPWSPAVQWPEGSSTDTKTLNAKQREAVIAITAPRSISLPPILIIGPYGTGKTFTLGKAIETLLSDKVFKQTHFRDDYKICIYLLGSEHFYEIHIL